jgi:EpsI family protein
MRSPRFWTVALLLVLAIFAVQRRGNVDHVPPSVPLSQLPEKIGGLVGTDVPLDGYVLDVLGKGDFLNRTYASAQKQQNSPFGSVPPVGLFIAYFPTQRTGQSIHSPQNCLPGSGWNFDSKGVVTIKDARGKKYRVGDYLISNGRDKDEVLYWYRTHGRTIASDYVAKWYTLTDSILYDETDAALIRVITPLRIGETQGHARERVVKFAAQLAPMLPAFVPN